MEDDESKLLALQEQTQNSPEGSARVAENIEGFEQRLKEVLEAIAQDQSFSEMTEANYDQKKSYFSANLQELSRMHRLLADQHAHLLRKVGNNKFSQRSKPSQASYKQNFSKPSKYVSVFMPDGGGFYLSEKDGLSNPIPVVIDDALKVKEADTSKDLVKNISSLEKEVVSLNKVLQRLRNENAELKQINEENISDVSVYMSQSKLKIKKMEQEFEESNDQNKKLYHLMADMLQEKAAEDAKIEAQTVELNEQISQHRTEITELKSKHEAREKVRNDVINRLKDELQVQHESVAGLEKTIDGLLADKCTQYNTIQELHARVNKLQFENVAALPSFDDVQKLINEMKLKAEELEREVDKQKEVMSDRT